MEQMDPGPVHLDVPEPVTSEQGGSRARDNEERELVLLVLVRNNNHYCTNSTKFLTSVRGEHSRRGQEKGSGIGGPEPIVCLIAHHGQGRTGVHFHDGFYIAKSYRDFNRSGSASSRSEEGVHCVL